MVTTEPLLIDAPLDDPHDPRERCFIYQIGDWYVLRHAANDPRTSWLAPRGRLHLQLYHAASGVSVLTPSRGTDGQYELGVGFDRYRTPCYRCLNARLLESHGIRLPCPRAVQWAERWFVRSAEFGSAKVDPDPTTFH